MINISHLILSLLLCYHSLLKPSIYLGFDKVNQVSIVYASLCLNTELWHFLSHPVLADLWLLYYYSIDDLTIAQCWKVFNLFAQTRETFFSYLVTHLWVSPLLVKSGRFDSFRICDYACMMNKRATKELAPSFGTIF